MNSVSFADADRDLEAVIDKVVADRAPVAIMRDDGEGAVLVSAGAWAAIQAVIAAPIVRR